MATVVANVQSGDPDTDALLAPARWNPTVLLRYGFPATGGLTWTGYSGFSEPYQNYAPLNAAQQAVVTAIFHAVEEFANITFVNSADVGETPASATFRFGMTDEEEVAHAYVPNSQPVGGDVWFNRSSGEFNNPVRGDYAYSAIMHEIGHALGLLHPHDGDNFGTMSLTHDNMNYTVMTYRSYAGMPLEEPFPNGDFGFPQTYMMYDIAALQHMYGANFNSHSGNTSYKWDPVTGYLSIDGSVSVAPGANIVYLTIWDGGGVDTYDFSSYSTNLIVDLIPGEWTITAQSQLADLGDGHHALGNIANAFLYHGDVRSLIENAVGGSGNDVMTGNQGANNLSGGGGTDTLTGGGGNDVLNGGAGSDDTAVYAGNRQDYEIGTNGQVTVRDLNLANGDDGTDTLIDVEYIQFADIKIQVGVNPNNPPVLGDPAMADQSWSDGNAHSYVIPGTSFIDPDGNQTLTFTATLANGAPLPAWLTFNPATRTFGGTPPVDQIGASLEIRVTASDGQASVSDNLIIGVTQAPGADIVGTDGPDVLNGTFRDELINGNDGDDVLRGSPGADRMAGQAGTDEADYSASPQAVTIDLVTGSGSGGDAQGDLLIAIERVVGSGFGDHIGGDSGQNRLDGGAGSDWLDGGAGDDLLLGGSGDDILIGGGDNDILDGGSGADSMTGGLGNDIFYVDNGGDSVTELAGEGTDEVRTGLASYVLGANFETLTGTSAAGQSLTGNGGANVIAGGSGNDLIDGGAGADSLFGGLGNDIYMIDDGGDVVTELAGEGTDEVRTGLAAYSIAGTANVENLTGLGFGQSLTGNGLANLIAAGAGNDMLDGGLGADTMTGGLGNDIFLVDDFGDAVIELGGEGNDEVRTALASYVLAANVELLTGTSNAGQALTGNDLANVIVAGAGNDLIDGGLGADAMTGGLGNDVYVVDSAGDSVNESAGAGTDEIRTALATYVLAANVENLTGTGAIDQNLTGNGADNVIDGGLGADTITGGLGNDIYIVDNVGDVVVELAGEGTDEVRTAIVSYSIAGMANVEKLTATSDFNHDFRGNGGDNVVTGAGGNDFIRLQDGGVDIVNGAGGNDVFLFGATLTSADIVNGGAGNDQVAIQGDYSAGLTLGANFTSVESFAILPGSDTRFGDPGTNFYDYNLTTVNANVAAGVLMIIDANRLRPGEDFTFNGSAETDGNFFLYGGGGTDTLFGGSNNDTFYFGENGQFGSTDHVDGGVSGTDQLGLRGNYNIVFGADQMVSIESIGLVSAQDTRFGALGSTYNYNLTMNDGNLAAGVRMTVDAAPLRPNETLTFNGSAETDGWFRIFGGQGSDTITGSQTADIISGGLGSDNLRGAGGADTFLYRSVADSLLSARDSILDFSTGDRIDLSQIDAVSGTPGNDAFTFIGSNAFSGTAGELRASFYAGNGLWTVSGDVNGDGVADIEFFVTSDHPIISGDFAL